jgi:multiple sugar transport system substrate-binding protein
MWRPILLLAAALWLVPFCARSADLVVWWEEGFYPQEDEAVREIIAAFGQETSEQVEIAFYPDAELPAKITAALDVGSPPDLAFGTFLSEHISTWAFDDRLVELSDTVGHLSDLFDPDALAWYSLLNHKTGRRGLYALPIGRTSLHLHVWKNLLEEAGFGLGDIPKEWDAFWSFWCDQVQPAVRRATGRDDIWGVGLSMSNAVGDTGNHFQQFLLAYEADYVTRDGELVVDAPEIRQRLVEAIARYTGIYREGCTPPASTTWATIGNNEAFLAQTVVMTPNNSLSIPNALKRERPEDYFSNTATIEWPIGPRANGFPIRGSIWGAPIFKDGDHVPAAKDFIRFLVAEGWLAHYLDFAGERMLPPMAKLLDAPFWLDPSDPHRMAAAMQVASRPMQYDYATVSGNWRYDLIWQANVWDEAIHRVAVEGVSPKQAVDGAIARIKQILSE